MNTYEQVVNTMLNLIENGVYKQGEKLPSLRNLSTQLHVSVNTIREAYWRMEDRNIIEAIPQSGYYVRAPWKPAAGNARPDPCAIDPKKKAFAGYTERFRKRRSARRAYALVSRRRRGALGLSTAYAKVSPRR
jgi:DNA-binding transcriptional regulator YhcF (GntR family)